MPEQEFSNKINPERIPQSPVEKERKDENAVEIEKELANLEKEVKTSEQQSQASQVKIPSSQTPSTPQVTAKSENRRKIEGILSEDLKELFQNMDVAQKAEFKRAGQETATALEVLVATAKETAKKVVKLISTWLKMIPGINPYYLEKEAKIKTDKILAINKNKEEAP